MRRFAAAWLGVSLVIVNLKSLPPTLISIVFLVSILLVGLRVRCLRPILAGGLFSLFTLYVAFLQLASHQLHSDQISKDLTLTAYINSVPDLHPGRLTFTAKVVSCIDCARPLNVKHIRLSWYGQVPVVQAGELWQFTVRLKPPTSQRNPGSFDSVGWHLVKGLHARGYVRNAASAKRLAASTQRSLASIRQNATQRLQALDAGSEQMGLVLGLAVGIKTDITDEQWDLLRGTGTAHLLAISGLHVGLVALWALVSSRALLTLFVRVMQFGGRFPNGMDTRSFSLIASFICATAYAALAGFELPTQRALVMLAVWMAASLRFRFIPPFAALCVAMLVVFLINPLNILAVGFWLSFGTVAILFYMHKGRVSLISSEQKSRMQGALQKCTSVLRTHVLLGFALIPVSAWFFQAGSVVAPLANLLAVPWVAMVCVPLALTTLASSLFSQTLASYLLTACQLCLDIMMRYLSLLDQSLVSSVVLSIPSVSALVCALISIAILLAPRTLGLRWFALPLLLPSLLHNAVVPSNAGLEVHVVDVGQGLAALVFVDDHTLLFDTGGKVSPSLSMYDAAIVPFLNAKGRRAIDTLVISHGDEDHSFGAVDVVRQNNGVEVYSSAPLDLATSHNQTRCAAGHQWRVGEVDFAFIHPAAEDHGSKNNRSCVLMIYRGNTRILLTGDIEAQAEAVLIERSGGRQIPPVTLMTAPHHGSSTSSTQAFIDFFKPQNVVFSTGQRNRYGFPHLNVKLRYKMAGSTLFDTGMQGAVSFVFNSDGTLRQPSSWWNTHRRFWHGIANPDCWQQFARQSYLSRLYALSQTGQILCGK